MTCDVKDLTNRSARVSQFPVSLMSIDSYNGSAVVAMAGEKCVAIASDMRFGVRMLTVSMNCQKIFKINNRIFLGLAGLKTDVDTVQEKLRYDVNLLELREERQIEPTRFINLVKSLLYKHRFGPYFVEPVIVGLEPGDNKPVIGASDSIGAMSTSSDFACVGTASTELYGACESLWRPGMGPDELFECCSKVLLSAIDRDSLSGWGGVVHVMTPEKVITRQIKTRMD